MKSKPEWSDIRRQVLSLTTCRALSRRLLRLSLRTLLVITTFALFLQILLAYIVGNDPRLLPLALQRAENLLIITAHPDDECLFFAPSILGVLGRKHDVRGGLLVLSTGNNYGIGEARKLELKGSCKALGIEDGRCLALDLPNIQDNPRVWWDEKAIVNIAKEYVERWDVDAIITFDEGGISGHINHRAVSAAIKNYVSTDVRAPATYVVSTTSLVRKYTFLADLPLTSLQFSWRILQALLMPQPTTIDSSYGDKALVVNTWNQYLKTRQAFGYHKSQYSWDRNLYLILSRYVWFNDLKRVRQQNT